MMPGASRRFGIFAGLTACTARNAGATGWRDMVMTSGSGTGSATDAWPVKRASTTLPTRSSPVIISRCGSGSSASTSYGDDPWLGMARILEDADVGACPFAGEVNVLQIEQLFSGAGSGRGLSGAPRRREGRLEDHEIALQAQPIAAVPFLTPADQIGGAVEAVPH